MVKKQLYENKNIIVKNKPKMLIAVVTVNHTILATLYNFILSVGECESLHRRSLIKNKNMCIYTFLDRQQSPELKL